MKEFIIYVHGKGGSAEKADHYKSLFPNYEVIGFEHRFHTAEQMRFLDDWIKKQI